MTHILDRPIWNALASEHAGLAEGGPLARRYPPSIVPFAAAADNTAESQRALAELPLAGEVMAIVEPGPVTIPESMDLVGEATLIQMIAKEPGERVTDDRIVPLTEADAAEMLELAQLTRPGPFTLGAQKLGTFWGIKREGRLIAMGGQRLKQPGYTELSGLCTHPDFQGKVSASCCSAMSPVTSPRRAPPPICMSTPSTPAPLRFTRHSASSSAGS